MQVQVLEALYLGFYQLIEKWLTIGYAPFNILFQIFPITSMPLLFFTVESLSILLGNRYFLMALPPLFLSAYRLKFLPKWTDAIQYLLMGTTTLLLAPYAFLISVFTAQFPLLVVLAAVYVKATYKLLHSMYGLIKPGSDWRFINGFKDPLSDESFLFTFIAVGISLSFNSPLALYFTGASILVGSVLFKIKNYFFPLPAPQLNSTINRTNPRASEQNPARTAFTPINTPTPVIPATTRLPDPAQMSTRLQQFDARPGAALPHNPQTNSLSPTLEQNSLFKKVYDFLKDPNKDYLLTENDNFFLRDAAEKENWELVARLLKKPNVAAQAHCGDWIVLRQAIQHEQWKIVSKFLKLPVIINTSLTEGKIDVINRLLNKVISNNQIDILNQIILSPAYELYNMQTRCTFLTRSLQHNKYAAIIKILNDEEFLEALNFNNFKDIFDILSDDHIQKVSSQSEYFLTHIKEFFPKNSITINQVNIAHLINKDFFGSLADVAMFFKKPFAYLESKTQDKPHIMIAMNFLVAKNTYLNIKNARLNARESAQNGTEVLMANELFETVKYHYQKTFENKKTENNSSLDVIEREIKTYLLDQILTEAYENISKEKDIKISSKIINIIDSNKQALLDGGISENLTLVRALNKLIPNNISAEQTAWLSYCATHNIDRNNWKFLVQPTEEHVVHSTAESAQATDQAMTNTMASQIIRERIAYYWLAVTDDNYPDEENFRLGNFVGAISTIYKTYGFGQSCCYPGHLTAIAQMGMHHPIAEPTTIENLIEQAIIAPIIQATKNTLEEHPNWSAEDKENFLSSITYIHENNAEELFHSEQSFPIDKEMYCAFIEHKSFIIDSVFDEILKNQRYKNRLLSFNEREEIKKGIEYKILGMASNQFIVSALNNLILGSRCIKKDICFDQASPFVPNTHKHKLYLILANQINNELLKRTEEKLPSIVELNTIGQIAKKIVDNIVSGKELDEALKELNTLSLSIDTIELEILNVNQESTPLLFQFDFHNYAQQKNKQEQITPDQSITLENELLKTDNNEFHPF